MASTTDSLPASDQVSLTPFTRSFDMPSEPPKLLARPPSAGNARILEVFQFGVAKKALPKLKHPARDTKPALSAIENPAMGHEVGGKDGSSSFHDEHQRRSKSPSPRSTAAISSEHSASREGHSSPGVDKKQVQNSTSASAPAQASTNMPFVFDLRPIKRPNPTTTKPDFAVTAEDLLPSVEEDVSGDIGDAHTESNVATQPGHLGTRDKSILAIRGRRDRSRSQSLQTLHSIAGAPKITKANQPLHRRVGSQIIADAVMADLPSGQMLQLLLRNIQHEKLQVMSTRRMKAQIEQLVRVNSDYQTKLEEAEQEIEEQGDKLQQYHEKFSKFKGDLLRLRSTVGDLAGDHTAMSSAAQDLKNATKSLVADGQAIRQCLSGCNDKILFIENKTAVTHAAMKTHRDEAHTIQAKLCIVKEKYKEKVSQLGVEQSRTARLEMFISQQMEKLFQKGTTTSEEFEPLSQKLGTVEDTVSEIRSSLALLTPNSANVTNTGIEKCLELIQALVKRQTIAPADLVNLNSGIERIEEHLIASDNERRNNNQGLTHAFSAVDAEMKHEFMSIKEAIDSMRTSSAQIKTLEHQIVRFDEATKHYNNLLDEVKQSRDFAIEQAKLPQEPVNKLLKQIEELRKVIVTESSKTQGNTEKMQADWRKIQNLKSQVEEEKQSSVATKASLDEQQKMLSTKVEEMKALETALASTKDELVQARSHADKISGQLQDAYEKIAGKAHEIGALQEELHALKGTASAQKNELDDLNAHLKAMETLKQQLAVKKTEIDALQKNLQEAKDASGADQVTITDLVKRVKDQDRLQRQLDALLQEKLKVDENAGNLERQMHDYQDLQERCKSLEATRDEVQVCRTENAALNKSVKTKAAEVQELKGKIEELEKRQSASRLPYGSLPRLSQEIPETLSEENLTPRTRAAFDELIEPDMLDEQAFQRIEQEHGDTQTKTNEAQPPRRKANRDVPEVRVFAGQKQKSQEDSQEPTDTQQTILNPESQVPPLDRDQDQVETSSLTQLSDMESLFGADNDAETEPRESQTKSSQQKLRRVSRTKSRISTMSDEMLLDSYGTSSTNKRRKTSIPRRSGNGDNHGSSPFTFKNRSRPTRTTDFDLPQSPDNTIPKEKPRPNSAAKRRAESTEVFSSPEEPPAKRLKLDLAAVEVRPNKSTASQSTRAQPTPKPTMRFSLPTGSKGSGRKTDDSASASIASAKRPKKTRSSMYDSRFSR